MNIALLVAVIVAVFIAILAPKRAIWSERTLRILLGVGIGLTIAITAGVILFFG